MAILKKQGAAEVAAAKYQKFISSGVFSVPEGESTVWVTMGGGGGGGGGGMVNYNAIVAPGGGGGQGQSVVLKEISVPSGATIPVTVGAGGAGGVSGSFIYKRRPPLSPGECWR